MLHANHLVYLGGKGIKQNMHEHRAAVQRLCRVYGSNQEHLATVLLSYTTWTFLQAIWMYDENSEFLLANAYLYKVVIFSFYFACQTTRFLLKIYKLTIWEYFQAISLKKHCTLEIQLHSESRLGCPLRKRCKVIFMAHDLHKRSQVCINRGYAD